MAMSPRLLRPLATGFHPDANDWRSRVVANGGSVSASTMRAVSKFCADIQSASIRDRFYRLNLMCGDNLSAALVPLYRAPSSSETQTGNAIDDNVGPFVGGDYTLTTGLQGDGANKWLNTGLTPNALDTLATGHISVRFSEGAPTSGGVGVMGAVVSSGQRYLVLTIDPTLTGGETRGFWGGTAAGNRASLAHAANNHTLVSRSSDTDLTLYRNGTTTNQLTDSVTPAASAAPFGVFAALGTSGARNTSFNVYAGRITNYSIGRVMTSTQAANYYTALEAFRTSIGRT